MVKAVLATLTAIVMASGKLHEAPPCSYMSTKDVKFSLVFRTPMHSRIIESLMVAFHRSYPFFVLGPLFHGKTCKFNGFWSCHTHSVGVIHSLAFDTFIVGVLWWFLHPLLSLVGMYWVMGIECLTVESLLIGSNYVKQYLGVSDSAIWFIGTHSIISKGTSGTAFIEILLEEDVTKCIHKLSGSRLYWFRTELNRFYSSINQ